jgi:manganese/zinc/iron transport system substrate-binding protein
MEKIIKRIGGIFLFFVLLQSCTSPEGTFDESQPLQIVATTGMVADLVKHIGKDSVQVNSLMGPGVDPHLYKATQGDLKKLQAADIIFYNGLHLEGKMGEVFEKLERVKTVVPIARGIAKDQLLKDPSYEDAPDPHIWFDVALWSSTIDEVLNTLVEKDPDNELYYTKNAQDYKAQLSELHAWVKQQIQSIPAEQRILITAHDAFSYFGRAYGIEVKGLQGISTLSEFGLRDRVDLVNFIVEKEIAAVFVETSVSEKNINSIVEGCRQKGHQVRIGGNLYSDAMGEEGSLQGTYVGMVRANVNTILRGLMPIQ